MPQFHQNILHWYHQKKRDLPWRDHPDPYAVWISEIMLQQTRVDTVIAYFECWMAKFPTIEKLASADEQDVLNLWEGLGYYSRARNLHKTARIVTQEYGGKLPEKAQELIKLPGIGRYTSAAISSMAFGHDAAALDGNIRRVYARLFDIDAVLGTSQAEKIFWAIADENLPKGKAGDYNQALMDLGATICTPRSPKCEECPVIEFCKSYKLGNQAMRPVRKRKKKVPHHVHSAAVIVEDGKVLLAQRPVDGLLGGMWEFPNGRVDGGNPVLGLVDVIRAGYQVQIHAGEALCIIDHAYTHFKITEHAYACTMLKSVIQENMRWVNLKDLNDYPMGKVDREIAKKINR